MAREVIEKLIDDLDGGDAVETVTFGLDGASYEIDLSRKNATGLRKSLDRYVKAGRRKGAGSTKAVRRKPTRRKKPAASTNGSKPQRGYDLVQLREWAGANSVAIPSRGRIPQTVVAQYKAAGGR